MKQEGRLSQIVGSSLALGLVAYRIAKHPSNGATAAHGVELSAPGEITAPTRTAPPVQTSPQRPEPRSGLRGKYYQIFKDSINRFLDDDSTTMAAALAYYTTFSIAPLLLIVISIVGLAFGREAVQNQIQTQVQGLIGQGAATQIGAMVQNAGQQSSKGILSAVLGIVALLFGATGAFTQLQTSLNRIWRVKPDPRAGGIKNFIGHRLLSFGMILAVAFLLLVSLAVSAALAAFGSFVSGFLPHGFSAGLLLAIGFLVSLAVITGLFAAMFKVLPDAQIAWRDVWVGAGITAVLFTIGKFLIGLYLGHSGTASAYGAAGSLVLIVLWIYYSSMILLFGAEFTAVWSQAYSGDVQPKGGAVKTETEER